MIEKSFIFVVESKLLITLMISLSKAAIVLEINGAILKIV
jgi:hypothetical protein